MVYELQMGLLMHSTESILLYGQTPQILFRASYSTLLDVV